MSIKIIWFGFNEEVSRTCASGESFYQNYCYRRVVDLWCGSSAEEDHGGNGNQNARRESR